MESRQTAGVIDVRRAVGLVGLSFPVVMVLLGSWRFDEPIPYALSSYYHITMALAFTWFMVTIGLFMVAYKGYPDAPSEDWLGHLGGAAAIATGIFPPREYVGTFGALNLFHAGGAVLVMVITQDDRALVPSSFGSRMGSGVRVRCRLVRQGRRGASTQRSQSLNPVGHSVPEKRRCAGPCHRGRCQAFAGDPAECQ